MRDIQKVVVLGATGDVGRTIVSALVEASFEVTVVTRSKPDSDPTHTASVFSSAVSIQTAELSLIDSLKTAFRDRDAIVEAFNPTGTRNQATIVEAALQCGIKHIITPDFSSDTFNAHVDELKIFAPKIEAQRWLEEKVKGTDMKWTAIMTGPFFDWAIPRGIFWVNPKSRTVTVFGSGNQSVSMSRLDICGRATVAVLSAPEAFANRPAYFADYTLSTNELLALLEDVSAGWKVERVPVESLLQFGSQKWEDDTQKGIVDRLNTEAYQMLGTYGVFAEGNRYGAAFVERAEKRCEKGNDALKAELEIILKSSN